MELQASFKGLTVYDDLQIQAFRDQIIWRPRYLMYHYDIINGYKFWMNDECLKMDVQVTFRNLWLPSLTNLCLGMPSKKKKLQI